MHDIQISYLFENENSFFNDDPEHHVHSALNSLNESPKLLLTPKAISRGGGLCANMGTGARGGGGWCGGNGDGFGLPVGSAEESLSA